MADDKNKQMFLSLVYSLQMQGMMQLGKLPNPMTNQTEVELDGAQVSIDMLDMLKEKTKGNLDEDETRFITQVISDLKLNYVDEKNKADKNAGEIKSGEGNEVNKEPNEVKEEGSADEGGEEKK